MVLNGKKIKCLIVLNMPRLTFTTTMSCLMQSIIGLDFEIMTCEGVFWEQAITNGMETNKDVDYLLFVDYDSVFKKEDIVKLFAIMESNPDIDAIYPIQVARHNDNVLCWHPDVDYSKQPSSPSPYGHFGLTVIRKNVFKDLPKPWLHAKPNPKGEWKEGKIDSDISFWELLRKCGKKVHVATDVIIGHMDIYVKWPRGQNGIRLQYIRDYLKNGRPKDAFFYIQPGKEAVQIVSNTIDKQMNNLPNNNKERQQEYNKLFKPLINLPIGI